MSEWLSAGDFSSAEGSSGWTDSSVGSQSWTLFKNTTSNGTGETTLTSFSSWSFHSQHQLNIFSLPYFRGIPVRGQVSRTAVDWSPGPDSPAGPHRASLHPELWVRPNWQPGSHRWVVLPCHSLSHLLTLLTHTSWTPQVSCPSEWLTACGGQSQECGHLRGKREEIRIHGARSAWLSEPENTASRFDLWSVHSHMVWSVLWWSNWHCMAPYYLDKSH